MNYCKLTNSFIVFIFSILPMLGMSQQQDFRFSHITTDDGLSQSNVTCIMQDSKGFMWFGTFNGLNKYNGYEFEVFNYQLNDSQSISHNYIQALFEDRYGYIWIGTNDGLNRFDPKTYKFSYYKNKQDEPGSISDNQIIAITGDSRGRMWIGTQNGGLNLYLPESDSFKRYMYDENDSNSISSDDIRFLFEDSDRNLWIAHFLGTIDILDNKSKKIIPLTIQGRNLSEARITSIVESPDKSIWIGTQGSGLYKIRYTDNKGELIAHYTNSPSNKNYISSNIILSLMLDRENKLWVGTEDNGITVLNPEAGTYQLIQHNPLDPSSLNHNSVWSIYEDHANNIWIGTYAYGINLLAGSESNFQHFKHLPGTKNNLSHNMVNSFWEDNNQNLWIATDGGGLNLYDRKKKKFTYYNSANSTIGTDIILTLYEDKKGNLWCGTWADGLYLFNRKQNRFIHFTQEKNGLGSNNILSITGDKNDGLWLCTFWGGITYLDPHNFSSSVFTAENSGLSNDNVRFIMRDFQGDLWIGTDVGLDHYDTKNKVFTNYTHSVQDPYSISKGFVNYIQQSSDSAIWVGTTSGLNRFDRKTKVFKKYNTSSGLPNNDIKCIIEGSDGILWLSTNKGISRFNTRTNTFKNYDVSDGLQGNEFNNCGLKTADGEIIFGGNNGFNIFSPDDLKDSDYYTPVILTDFKIFNKSVPIKNENAVLSKHISETHSLELTYKDAVFSFDYVALNYISPGKMIYAYMMEGFESDWNYVGNKRTATYTNLDPGKYVFMVKASDNEGFWDKKITSIDITIHPPFWKTWWAYSAEALIIIAIFYFIINYYISRQKLKNALQIEHMELEKMYELDQMKTQFFTNIAHEFYSPMTLILSPLEKLLSSDIIDDKIKNSIKLIHRNAQRLYRMTNQLKDFQKIETDDLQLVLSRGNIIHFIEEIVHSFNEHAQDRGITFQFITDHDHLQVWFDTDKLDKIIYNLLSNAFKFTADNGEISIRVDVLTFDKNGNSARKKNQAKKYIEIIVEDNGIGIPGDKIEHIFERYYHIENYNGKHYDGSGVGLAFVNELVKLHNGEISVNSSEGQGARFTVRIPIDEHYLEENQLVGEFNITPENSLFKNEFTGQVLHPFDDTESQNEDLTITDIPIVLVIDDDAEIRDYIKKSLESRYRIITVENGRLGIEKAFKLIPDLIISDIKMPEINGIDLCNSLKEDEKTSHIPVILLTAYSSHENKIEGLRKGADAYIPKPFNIDELEAHIVNLLKSRKKLIEKYSREILLGPKKVKITDLDENFLQRVIETIEKHISETKFNADVLSKKVGMSRMQLYRKIKGLTDQTVHEFIRSIRLKRAVQLLQGKRMTITEVAYEVGFNDLTYFARCFRKQYRKSPSEFISERN